MRTQSEIKRNNIRKANLVLESQQRNNKGSMASSFGLYEQCGVGPAKNLRDSEGIYMGAPTGTEPMLDLTGGVNAMTGEVCANCGEYPCMCGDEMGGDMSMDANTGMPLDMDDAMKLIFMQENKKKKAKPDFLDVDKDGDTEESMKKATKDKVEEEGHYKKMDHTDRDEFDGRDSEVIGVDSDINKQRLQKENYKAVNAKPLRDSWGNKYNQILNENSKVSGAKSLMNRMKKIIK
tara:strand:- start:5288 stop:5992 length:705 start_codon:yes stop_codon:yes gene_type:complete